LLFACAPAFSQDPAESTERCRSIEQTASGSLKLDCPGLNSEGRAELLRWINNSPAMRLLEIKERVNAGEPLSAPRRLATDQKKMLLGPARTYAGQEIRVVHLRNDVESETLAGDIAEVLDRAGWTGVDGGSVQAVDRAGETDGILIEVGTGNEAALRAAQMLQESLNEFGVVTRGANASDLAATAIRVTVGSKPRNTAPRTVAIQLPHTALIEADPFVCPRLAPGDLVNPPPELRSQDGVLRVDLFFHGGVSVQGMAAYCYLTADGLQAPTLRVRQGDELILTLKNQLPVSVETTHDHVARPEGAGRDRCQGGAMGPSSTNLHFHGWMIPPTCHQDETLRTVIQPSDDAFEYRVRVPMDQPPGLYWYHPHPHGFSEPQVLGGASGALIVEGVEQWRPEVAGLPERVVVLRDQRVAGFLELDEDAGPGKDLSVNFVPLQHPVYHPAEMAVRPGVREFWRVLNAAADTYFDLQLQYGGAAQQLRLVAIDGVAVDDTFADVERAHILLSPGARAEFVVTTPDKGVTAELVTMRYDTGPDGVVNPTHVLAAIRASENAPALRAMEPMPSADAKNFAGLENAKPVTERRLYFSEDVTNLLDPKFFVTLEGAEPKIFRMDFKEPDVTVKQGTVEDWVIENRAKEAHAFHIHQLHFQLLERDGERVAERALRDTVDLPFWDGESKTYPSVKIRMDFRGGEIVGTFVFHCHILEHEDGGMMGAIQVLPAQ
jgi:FtsP/CotA-like multicopper oxidase with cupredoxin domain